MRPTPGLYAALLAWSGLAGAALAWPAALPAWGTMGGLLLLLLGLEALLLRRTPLPEVTRTAPLSLAVGTRNQFALRLTNRAARPLRLRVKPRELKRGRPTPIAAQVSVLDGRIETVSGRVPPAC